MSSSSLPFGGAGSQEADLRQLGQALGEGEHSRATGGGGVTSDLSLDEILLLHSVGLEPAQVVFGVGCISIASGMWAWSQGRVVDATTALRRALAEAKDEIRGQANNARALGVLGVEIELHCQPRRYLVTVSGTAVRTGGEGGDSGQRSQPHHASPFLCDLSARDFVVLRGSGWYPLDLVAGASYVHAPRRNLGTAVGQATQNVELTNFTETLYQAREEAMAELQREIQLAGGSGVVHATLIDRPVHFARHVVEFVAYGTAIKRVAPEHTHPNISVVVPLDDERRTFEASSLL